MEQRIFKKIIHDVQSYGMIQAGDRILVGLSGGADSVFLLHMLLKLQECFDFTIAAAHVNHGIRGAEAVNDQVFSQRLCDSLGIKFFTRNYNVPEYAKKNKVSDEAAGREIRYSYFNELCSAYKYNKIAVAHNMNDSVETLMLNLIRGCSLNGLGGIQPTNVNIIRPIISISREEIEAYLNKYQIGYCIDSTNSENIYSRNIVRNCIVEKMKQINPSAVKTIYSNMSNYAADDNFITEYVNGLDCIYISNQCVFVKRDIFDKQHKAVKKRIIFKAFSLLWGNTLNLEGKHIDILISDLHSGQSFDMPRDSIAVISFQTIMLAYKSAKQQQFEESVEPGTACELFPGTICKVCFADKVNLKEKNSVYIDYDKVHSNHLVIRNRLDGDRFIPYGMKGEKKLKQFFIDLKIPVYDRDKIPILCDNEVIAAVIPYRISDLYKIDNTTKRILKIQIVEEDLA